MRLYLIDLNMKRMLYYLQIWCIIQEKARTLKNIVVDPHSYPKFR